MRWRRGHMGNRGRIRKTQTRGTAGTGVEEGGEKREMMRQKACMRDGGGKDGESTEEGGRAEQRGEGKEAAGRGGKGEQGAEAAQAQTHTGYTALGFPSSLNRLGPERQARPLHCSHSLVSPASGHLGSPPLRHTPRAYGKLSHSWLDVCLYAQDALSWMSVAGRRGRETGVLQSHGWREAKNSHSPRPLRGRPGRAPRTSARRSLACSSLSRSEASPAVSQYSGVSDEPTAQSLICDTGSAAQSPLLVCLRPRHLVLASSANTTSGGHNRTCQGHRILHHSQTWVLGLQRQMQKWPSCDAQPATYL